MDAYYRLIELLIKRELGILGRQRMEIILKELGITYDFNSEKLLGIKGSGAEVLQRLGEKIYETGGEIALIGARVSMILNAVKEGVQLPPIFS